MRKKAILALFLMVSLAIGAGFASSNVAAEPESDRLIPEILIHTTTRDYDDTRYEAALYMQRQLEGELGLKVEVRPLEFRSLMDAAREDPFEQTWNAVILSWSGRIERTDPDVFLYMLFHSSQAARGSNNFGGYQSAAYDALADAQRQTLDPEKRREIVYEAQEILADDVPLIALRNSPYHQGINIERWDKDSFVHTVEGLNNEWYPYNVKPLTDDTEFRWGDTQDLATVNPFAAGSTFEWKTLRFLYDKLLRLGPDLDLVPSAAESFEVVDDQTIDVVLRQNMTFHDGEPVTPQDVKFTFDYMMEHGIAYFDAFLAPLDRVELLEDETIRFYLKEPNSTFLSTTLTQIVILPQHIWEGILEEKNLAHPDEYENIPLIGSGPYEFDYWRRGEEISIKRFDDYFRADEIDVERISYIIYGHEEGIMGALDGGHIDGVFNHISEDYIPRVERMEHIEYMSTLSCGFHHFTFNVQKAPFDDVNMRRAVAHLIDFNELLEVVYLGAGNPLGAGKVIAPDNEYWHNPGITEYTYDPERAREILREAGYEWDSQGRIYFPEQ